MSRWLTSRNDIFKLAPICKLYMLAPICMIFFRSDKEERISSQRRMNVDAHGFIRSGQSEGSMTG